MTTAATLGAMGGIALSGHRRVCRAPVASGRAAPGARRRRRTADPRCPPASATSSRCCAPAGSSSTRPTRSSTTPRPPSRTGWSAARTSPTPSCSTWPGRSAATASSARPSWSCRRARRTAGLVVAARVAPLGADHVLLLVEDRTEARRRRGDPPRLRRQRQPRAQDPGRRHLPCSPRPCSTRTTTPRRWPGSPSGSGRVRPADPARQGDRRPVPAAGGRRPSTTRTLVDLGACAREAVDRSPARRRGQGHRARPR